MQSIYRYTLHVCTYIYSTRATNRHMIFLFFFIQIAASTECHVAAAAFYRNNFIPAVTRSRSSSVVFTFWKGGHSWYPHHSSRDTPLPQLCAVTQSSSSLSGFVNIGYPGRCEPKANSNHLSTGEWWSRRRLDQCGTILLPNGRSDFESESKY